MSPAFLGVISASVTGLLTVALVGILGIHARFIRMEDQVKAIRTDVASLKRAVFRGMRMMSATGDWTDEEKQGSDKKW